MVWGDLERLKLGKNAEKNPDFLGSRWSAAALFLGAAARGGFRMRAWALGAAALEGCAAALGHFGSPKVEFLGLLPGDSGDGSDTSLYGFRGPGSAGLVPGRGSRLG